jgi:hypothetical protein
MFLRQTMGPVPEVPKERARGMGQRASAMNDALSNARTPPTTTHGVEPVHDGSTDGGGQYP